MTKTQIFQTQYPLNPELRFSHISYHFQKMASSAFYHLCGKSRSLAVGLLKITKALHLTFNLPPKSQITDFFKMKMKWCYDEMFVSKVFPKIFGFHQVLNLVNIPTSALTLKITFLISLIFLT